MSSTDNAQGKKYKIKASGIHNCIKFQSSKNYLMDGYGNFEMGGFLW